MVLALFLARNTEVQAANITSAATGNWNITGTWVGGIIPVAGDNVTIASGHIVTVTADANASTLTIAANSAVGGNGATINSGITLNISGAVTMTAPTAATTNLTVGAGILNAASIAIPGSATAGRFATVSVSTGTITVTGSITFSGTAAQARFTSTGAGTVNVGGNFGSGGTLTTSSTGTINFNGSVAQTVGAYTTYNNITINNTSGGVSFLGTTTIGGTLTVDAGTLTFGAITATVTGQTTITGTVTISSTTGTKTFIGLVTINSGGVWNNTANEAVTFRGGITHNGTTFTAGTGVHTFNTNGQAIGGTTAISIPNVTITGVTLTNNTTLTVNTALSGTGGLTQGSGATLNIRGTSAITTLTASASGNVVNYNGTAAQTIRVATYVTLKSNNTAGATLGGAITLTTLIIGDATANSVFSDGGFLITLSGSNVLDLTSGTFRLGSATVGTTFPSFATINIAAGTTVNYVSGVVQTVSSVPVYQNLTISGAGTKTPDASLTIAGNLTVNATGGTFDLGAAFSHTVTGNVVLTAGTVNGGSSVLTLSGNWTGAGTFTANTGTIVFTGTSAQTIGNAATTFNHLTIDKALNTASFGANVTVNGNLTITSGTLGIGGVTVTATGTTDITGTVTLSSTTGTKIFTGLVTINSGGVWNNTANEAVTFRGGITHNGTTFTAGTGAYTFDTNSQTIGGTTAISIPSMTVTGVTLTNDTTLTVNTALSGTGGLTQGSGVVLNLGGSSGITTLDATVNSNTVNYTSTTAVQTVKGTTYHHLTINKSGRTATLGAATTVNGDLTVTAGTLNTSTLALTANGLTNITGILGITGGTGAKLFVGLVTINAGGAWNNSANAAVTFQGGITHNGTTFTAGTGVQTFDTNSQAIGGTTAISIPSVTVTGVTLTNDTTLTVNTALSGTGGLTQGSGMVLNLGGSSGITTLDASVDSNTVNYTSTTAAQTVKGTTYHHLTINKSGRIATLGAATTVNGDLAVTAGTLNTSTLALTANGLTNITGTLGITGGTGAKLFVGLVTINAGGAWNNSANAAVTFRGGIIHNGTTFTAGTGAYTFDTNSQAIGGTTAISIPSVTVTGVTLTNNTTLAVNTALSGTGGLTQGSSVVLNIGGSSGITTLDATVNSNTVNYTSTTAAQTVKGTTYHHLTINKSGQTATLGAATTVNGDLTVTAGTLDTSGNNFAVTLNGSFMNSGIFTANGSDITIGGTSSAPSIAGFSTTGALFINRTASTATLTGNVTASLLTMNGSGGTLNLGASLSHAITGNVTLTAGTLDGNSSILSLTGNWNNDDTFVAGSGGIIFNGSLAQTIGGTVATTFNHVTISNTGAAVSVNTSFRVDGVLTVNANAMLNPAAAVTVSGAGTLTGSGTVQVTRTTAMDDFSLQYTITNKTLTNLTVDYAGTAAQEISALSYGSLKISNTAATVTASADFNVSGTLTVNADAVLNPAIAVVINNAAAQGTITGSGTVQVTRTAATADYVSQYKFTANILNNLTVDYAGTAAQTVSALTYGGVKISNSTGVTLAGTTTVNGVLTLAGGNVTTGSFAMVIESSGSVSRTSGHIAGNLEKVFAAGAQSFTYHIGDATGYTPLDITSLNVTTPGNVTAGTTATEHPGVGASGINSAKSVNRFWTLTAGGGFAFTTYDATFTFVAGDVDGSAATASFVVRHFNGSVWVTTTPGAKTATSTEATGISSLGDFAIGQQEIDHYVVSASSPQTAGIAFPTTVTAKDVLNETAVHDNSTVVTMSSSGNVQFDSNGDASFGDNTKTLTAGTFTISTKDTVAETVNIIATDENSKTGSITGLITNPGALTNVVFVQQPTDAVAGNAISPATTVQLKDAYGNNVPTAGVSILISLTTGTGVLSGTSSQTTDVHGLATFGDLSINLAGTKNLTGSGTGLASDVSNTFIISAGPASQVEMVQQPTDAVAGGSISPAITVQLKDVYGNNVPTASVPILMSLTTGTGALTGMTSRTTDVNGLATFHDLNINLVGIKNLTASSGSLTSAVSNAFAIIAGAAAKVQVETAADGSGIIVPPQSITSGRLIAVYAVTRDASDNYIANVAADVWSLENTTGGVVSGDLIPGGDSKSAVFTGHFSGTAEIKATSGSLTPTNSGILTVIPGVTFTSPSHETTGVAINTAISALFSEVMEATTFTMATFTLNDGTVNISGSVSYTGMTATFTPSGSLLPSTVYTATITNGVEDLTGNAMAADYTWSFTTGTNTDIIPPTVSFTSPANKTTGVAVNGAMSAVFSEAIDVSTMDTATFVVNNGSGNINGSVSYTGTTAMFTPSGNLAPSTVYTATITTGVKDLAGNAMVSDHTWSFTTGTNADTTSPSVNATNPANGAIGIAINRAITVTFREVMDVSTISIATFTVRDGNNTLGGAVTCHGSRATFTPLSDLSPSTTYTATITTGVKDRAGNVMASDYTWGFTTGTNADTTSPTVSGTNPVDGAIDVAINGAITVTFREVMDVSTMNTATFVVNDGSSNVSGAVTYHGTTSTFTPLNNLFPFTDYTVTIAAGVQDLAGNSMASDYTWSFTTGMDTTVCTGELMTVSPSRLRLKAGGRAKVKVTLTGDNNCPVAGETISTQIIEGATGIIVLPKSPITNVNGQAEFIIITDYWRTARGWVRFISGNVRARLKIN